MKHIFSFAIVCLLASTTNAQELGIWNEKMNVVYVGVFNPMNYILNGSSCNAVRLTTTNGLLKKEGCTYNYYPENIGLATIVIEKRTNNKWMKVGERSFRAKRIPAPVFKIASGRRIMAKAELAAQLYCRAQYENIDICANAAIDSLTILVLRKQDTLALLKNYSNALNDDVQKVFNTLQTGDLVLFYDIYCHGIDGLSTELDPSSIIIAGEKTKTTIPAPDPDPCTNAVTATSP